MAQTDAKSILKVKEDILGEKDCLLGKDFWNQVVNYTEAKTKMHNTVWRKNKDTKAQPQASKTHQMLFQENLSRQQGYIGSGGEGRATNKFFYLTKGRQNQSQGKVSVITSPFLNSFDSPVLIPDSDLQNVHPFVKNLFQGMKIPQVPPAGRLKDFLKCWQKFTRGPNILGITQGF